jgi:hypothetical protein
LRKIYSDRAGAVTAGDVASILNAAPNEDAPPGLAVQIAVCRTDAGRGQDPARQRLHASLRGGSDAILKFTDPKTGIPAVREDKLEGGGQPDSEKP